MASRDSIGTSPSEVQAFFANEVVPLAAELGLMGNLSYVDFIEALVRKEPDGKGGDEYSFLFSILQRARDHGSQRDSALMSFSIQAMCVELLREKSGLMPETIRLGVVELLGYLRAMKDARADTVRRGANGRRLIGATSREKVRQAALRLGSSVSKELAAPDIADAVGLSSARVRKLLGELFPGEAWPPRSA